MLDLPFRQGATATVLIAEYIFACAVERKCSSRRPPYLFRVDRKLGVKRLVIMGVVEVSSYLACEGRLMDV